MPMIATTMPSTRPMTVAAIEMMRVLRSPVPSIWGRTCHMASTSRNVRRMVSNQSMGDFSRVEEEGPGGPAGKPAPREGSVGLLAGGEVLVGHRGAREPLLVELLPGAVLHGLVQGLVQCLAEGVVARLEREARGCVERRDVDRQLEAVELLGVLLRRLVVEELRIDRAAVQRGDPG